MEAARQVLLEGEFGGSGGSRYALTLTREELLVRRLVTPERQLVLPLRHVLACRLTQGGGRGRRSEAGEEEEEVAAAAAHFALYCYLPKRGLAGTGRSRVRSVKTFRVDGGGGREENRALARRWADTVGCLLLGMEVPAGSEMSLGLLPRPRRLLLLVNPRSGRSTAMSLCHDHVLPMISEANISYNLVCTEHQNHAWKLVQEIELSEWDGIIIVSGDGLLHEVINGLMSRADWETAIKTPLGIIPAGSGNALAAAINHNAGYRMAMGEELLLNCLFLLCRGSSTPMDLVSVTTARGRRLFSFLSVAWGFVADVDIESERYRRLGPARFTLGTLVRLASLRRYRGRLSYLPPGGRPKRPLCRSTTASAAGEPAPHPPLGRALSDAGIWRGSGAAEHSPPLFNACEGFSFEGVSFQEEAEGPGECLPEGGASARQDRGPVCSEGDFVALGAPGEVTTHLPTPEGPGPEGGVFPGGPGQGSANLSVRESPGRVSTKGDISTPAGNSTVNAGLPALEGTGRISSEGGNFGPRGTSEVNSNISAHEGTGPVSSEGGISGPRAPGKVNADTTREGPGPVSFEGGISGPLWDLPPDDLLPPLDEPVPGHWETVEQDFVLVLAIYQSHLGADLMAAPFARFADRALHLCYVTAGISRAALLRLFLAMEKGAHFGLDCPHLVCVPALAFRLEPLGPGKGTVTVDGERVEYGPLQGQLHPGLARVIAGAPPAPAERH